MKRQILFFITFLFCVGFYSCQKEPHASFTVSREVIYTGQAITFTNTSTNSYQYEWNFGDGNRTVETNPTYSYSTPGTYEVILVAYSKHARRVNVAKQVITIRPMPPGIPVTKFTTAPSVIYCSSSVSFTDKSTNEPIAWAWNFGDGTTSAMQNPTHTFSTPGNYIVSLVATNVIGSDSIADTVTVNNHYVALAGTYIVTDVVKGTYPDSSSYTITVNASSTECTRLYLHNFGGFGPNVIVYCDVSGTTLTIPSQSPSGMPVYGVISGTGVVNSIAIVSISYTINYTSGGSNTGNAVYIKQ